MNTLNRIIISLLLVGTIFSCSSQKDDVICDYTQYVDPFIGTGGGTEGGYGITFPGAASPFGMMQISPDNGGSGWQYASGYKYEDEWIAGFSHLHCSGTGKGDLNDISLMPTTKEIKEEYFIQSPEFVEEFLKDNPLPFYDVDVDEGEVATFENNLLLKYRSKYSHDKEKASPGYYYVNLLDDNIDVELTTSELAGMHRYTFNEKGKEQHLILDLGFTINKDRPVKTFLEIKGDNMITGYRLSTGWADDQRVYFAINFSRTFKEFQSFMAEEGSTETEIKGSKVKGVFTFDNDEDELLLKVAISSASVEGAIANLGTADKFNWDFDTMHASAKSTWNQELGKIKITTDNEVNKKLFYTSLYHSFLVPYRFSDIDGYYKGFDGKNAKAEDYTHYTILSLWDTFRALNPLFTFTQPELYNNIILSMLSQYEQTGMLPYWEIMGNEGGSMIGFHAVSLIADAIIKGIDNFDNELAYKAMIDIAHNDRKGLKHYREYGYVPTDKYDHGTVSETVEYCYNDWCIAQVAKHMGKEADYKKYIESSENYRILFDPEYKLMRGKTSTGEWCEPFHPRFSQWGNPHFLEGNSWHYSWFVPQNIEGMVDMFGGPADFEMMLDSLFTQTSEQLGKWTGDVSGLIGQYAHGNEPSHHVAYLYNYAGKTRKTQHRVNQILTTLYDDTPIGICGNEDCGQMSAWYVFSSLGFYPVNPVSGNYDLAAPLFDKAEITLPNGNVFTIVANNISDKNIIAESVKLNGELLEKQYISYKDLMNGGTLEFEMTE